MTLDEIKKVWTGKNKSLKSSVEWWNHKAESFAAKKIPTSEDSIALRIIEREHMLKEGQKALDIGCGGGRFSFALEKMGADVLGFDFSPEMIKECEKARDQLGSNVRFTICDFKNTDVLSLGWEKKFDLVLANMTPAVNSYDTLLKMNEVSSRWCLMTKHTRRENSMADKLNSALGFKGEEERSNDSMIYTFATLWLLGKKPFVEYENQVWRNTLKVSEAIEEYTLKLAVSHEIGEKEKKIIAKIIEENSKDGEIEDVTDTLITAIYWKV